MIYLDCKLNLIKFILCHKSKPTLATSLFFYYFNCLYDSYKRRKIYFAGKINCQKYIGYAHLFMLSFSHSTLVQKIQNGCVIFYSLHDYSTRICVCEKMDFLLLLYPKISCTLITIVRPLSISTIA